MINEGSKFEAVFTKVTDRASRVAAYLAAALVMPWTALFLVYVVLRKSGLANWEFVEEYTEYWMVFVTSLALAYTFMANGHIRIEVVGRRLPKRISSILEIVVTLLALCVVGIFTQHGINHFLLALAQGYRNVAGSEALLWPFYLWMPVGYGLLGLALLLHLYHSVVKIRKDWPKSKTST